LCTLDIIQLTDHAPARNEKLRALRQTVAAGGPATNAAVTFAHCGGSAHLLTGLGRHALVAGIVDDLATHRVSVRDLAPERSEPPAVSSIVVTQATGDRAVVSTNASSYVLHIPEDLDQLVAKANVVELDGHHMALAQSAAEAAADRSVLTVLDGGSWKPGSERLLRYIDVAVCSADFRPPGTATPTEVLGFLLDAGVRRAAITQGSQPVLWREEAAGGEIPVPRVEVADTLGAGDILHGALAYALATGPQGTASFSSALELATTVASRSCRSFGTRTWMLNATPTTPPGYSASGRPSQAHR
jgi:sugar/nucleoside kinase (ribokinase family)